MSGKLDTEAPPEGIYWVTRNKTEGVLAATVEVWVARPERMRFDDGDVMWMGSLAKIDEEAAWHDEWTIANCLRHIRVIPETDLECILVGDPDDPRRRSPRPARSTEHGRGASG